MNKISVKLVNSLIENDVIKKEEEEIYLFGFHQGFTLLLHMLTVLAIGLLSGMLLESVVFMVAYSPIRQYAGGIHAKTPVRCYFVSIFLIMVVLYVIKLNIWNFTLMLGVTFISSLILFLLSPVEDKNKPLEEIEISIYRKKANQLNLVLVVLAIVTWRIHKTVSISISLAMFTLAIMLILGVIKNRIIDYKASKAV